MPPRTCRSQRSYEPPRRVTAPPAVSRASTPARRTSAGAHSSLHKLSVRTRGSRRRGEHGGAGAVHRLEGRAAPDAEVHAATTGARAVADAAPVDAALPRHVPSGVVALGPLALQQRLGRAVAALLAQVGAHGRAAMVQDD